MESYRNLLVDVLEHGEVHEDRTGVGTLSLFGGMWRHNMNDGFPLVTLKKVPLRLIFEELRWFLSGSSDVKVLQHRGVKIWDEWATAEKCAEFGRKEGDLGPVYGSMWRRFPTTRTKIWVDQIYVLLEDIKNNPNSRRHIVTAWHPESCKQVTLPPCHWAFQVKCHNPEDAGNREMSMIVHMRSVDLFLGLPFDIASYGLLLKMLAMVTGYKPRNLVFTFGDMHIYNTHMEQTELMLSRRHMSLPKVEIAKPDKYLSPLAQLLSFHWAMFTLKGYHAHGTIKAEVAV